MRETGAVHGRFQPFHNGHLEYVLEAKKLVNYLWIGITKFDTPPEIQPLGRERERPENNPLSYFERIEIIAGSLVDQGIERSQFGFIPFPIERPDRLRFFLPTSVVCFTTIFEDWNREKVAILQRYGYNVEVLWERPQKSVSGADVRNSIIRGDEIWRDLVPTSTAKAVERLGLRSRLLELSEKGRSGSGNLLE